MGNVFKSNFAKLIASVLAVLLAMLFTSFTTQLSIKDQLYDSYKQSIREVIKEEIIPVLEQQGEAIERVEKKADSLLSGTYDDMVRNITKYYEKYSKGDYGDLTKTNIEAMTGWWKQLPDDRKTDALKIKYDTLISYYPDLK